jgi:TolA-binding protein
MRRAGAGMTAAVAVLFVVLLVQVRLQSNRIQQLQDKVQTMENANDLERTNALEEQLRSTVERLQGMEGLEQAVQRLSAEQANLKLQIGRGGYDSGLPPDLMRPPALPKLPSGLE